MKAKTLEDNTGQNRNIVINTHKLYQKLTLALYIWQSLTFVISLGDRVKEAGGFVYMYLCEL